MSHYETAYQLIWQKAIELYENGKTITCEELRVWLNNQLPDNFQYGLLSGSVFHAAWVRADDYGKEAMESGCFLNYKGPPLPQ